PEGLAGDNVGVLLRGVKRDEVERGQVLALPGSITPHRRFAASVYVLGKDEGGRHTPIFPGYRPQFYFRTTDVTGTVTLPEGVEMCMPGDAVTMEVELPAGVRSRADVAGCAGPGYEAISKAGRVPKAAVCTGSCSRRPGRGYSTDRRTVEHHH